jgi:hypothetical protein
MPARLQGGTMKVWFHTGPPEWSQNGPKKAISGQIDNPLEQLI